MLFMLFIALDSPLVERKGKEGEKGREVERC